jgi:predicted alpha/beta hydrolase
MSSNRDVVEQPLVLSGLDGTPLAARWYAPPQPGHAIVLVAGATAVPQRFYRPFSTHLASRGYEVLTFDYRGIAESRQGSLRGFHATMQDWGADLQAAFELCQQRASGRPVLLVAHSFGGQALGLLRGGQALAGGLTIGAQLGYYGHWPLPQRWAYGALWYAVLPAVVGVMGYLPGRLGTDQDLPGGVALEWARWCRSPRYLLDHVPEALDRFASVRAPMRVIAVTDDAYAPQPAVRAYAALLPRAQLEVWSPERAGVASLGHFGFFRTAGRRLWEEATAFLDDIRVHTSRRSA